ncbi:adenosine deaminase [Glaciecola sp. XM2]|jgi:adenosine deaminase|uniref:adenosine deaminase n=1 Tax=Glaciecola sp. XM2 TaxID=1914931 RepID=UPI001BDF2119|nr:adenosine deaminase [Glaciecola sp. XM2]MBT1449577.1 adenosine deaminase [Glaciecola sp. XM2]
MVLNIPAKVELHRHLDGNIRVSTILALANEFDLPLPSYELESLQRAIYIQDRTSDLLAFLQKLDYGVSVLVSAQACERVAYENVEDLARENIAYGELRFSPYYMAMKHNLQLDEVVAAVVRGVLAAQQDFNVKVNLIGILSRTFGVEHCHKELDALLAHHKDIVALDLAGDEKGFPAKMFQAHFDKAKALTKWRYTIHAGEADGAQSVWDAIHYLHADRIGHGVRAIEDKGLLDYVAANKIGIESCLTSNYQTGTWIDTPSHPMLTFLERGIEVSLHTDDPGVSNITLDDEFALAKRVLGISDEQSLQLKINAINQAFISENHKASLLHQP